MSEAKHKSYSIGIYHLKEAANIAPVEAPRFCDSKLEFFNPIFLKTLGISETHCDGQSLDWKVTFFNGSDYAHTLSVITTSTDILQSKEDVEPTYRNKSEPLLAKVSLMTSVRDTELDNLCKQASWFIRGSETFTADQLQTLSNGWRQVDGRGMVLFERYNYLNQPKRLILLLMLAIAYFQAFQAIHEKLANILETHDNLEELEKLYAEAAEFNARFYFANPIQLTRYPTYRAWQDISNAYQLPQKHREVTEQIIQVHQILNHRKQQQLLQEKEAEKKIADKRNYRITMIGVVLSILGLIEVIDVVIGWIR